MSEHMHLQEGDILLFDQEADLPVGAHLKRQISSIEGNRIFSIPYERGFLHIAIHTRQDIERHAKKLMSPEVPPA